MKTELIFQVFRVVATMVVFPCASALPPLVLHHVLDDGVPLDLLLCFSCKGLEIKFHANLYGNIEDGKSGGQ